MRWLPVVLLGALGCGGTPPVAPKPDVADAPRVFALALDLESGRKSKQALAAYRQVVSLFPDTPEARKAARKISEAQRAAMRRVEARRSK